MKRIFDYVLFLIAKLREIYSFFKGKKNETVEKRLKEEIKKEEKNISEKVENKKIDDLNTDLGWKE